MALLPSKFYFDNFLDDLFDEDRSFNHKFDMMKCDIYEKDGKYHMVMDIPGVQKENIKIECNDGYLTVSATQHEEKKDESKNYIRRERSFGEFKRQFYVGDVDMEDIKAEFKDGVLNVTIPKFEEKSTKKVIEIE